MTPQGLADLIGHPIHALIGAVGDLIIGGRIPPAQARFLVAARVRTDVGEGVIDVREFIRRTRRDNLLDTIIAAVHAPLTK